MPNLTLGLDVGANSIGWALLSPDSKALVASGVRVFPEGVDNFDTKKEKSKTEARRVARGMRRQIARRSVRKRQLRHLLTEIGLLPVDAAARASLDGLDPYSLRCRALEEKLTPHELGRLLIHLNQRRGFKSNRKSDRGRKADDKGLLGEISELAKAVHESGSETLGKYLAGKLQADPLMRIRNQHTRRDMFEKEFDLCWTKQQPFHPELLTDAARERVRSKLIFFQRPMYWPASVVGRCELEPRHRRCPRADRLAQRFRLLQEVNNLRYYDPDAREERSLSQEQRSLLLEKLSAKDKMTFDQIRDALEFLETVKFNLERGKRAAIKGLPADKALSHEGLFGKRWNDFDDARKDQIVRELIDTDDDKLPELAAKWKLRAESIDALAKVDLPDGYASLSLIALEKLIPHMQCGLLYMTDDNTPCALIAAGYLRPDQIAGRILSELPNPPDVANPVVRQALFELRKVVNAIIREYGQPVRIHIELARNATMSADQRSESSKHRQENEDRRSDAAADIRATGFKVSRDGIDRILLWKDQNEKCIYSGRAIGITQLLQGEVDVDHILPYSRCLDDSMSNKVVAFRALNHEKGNRTPREWLESDPARFEQVLQFASRLPYPKRKRFAQKELELDKFVERQLNDTRYIARTAANYLRSIVEKPHFVLCPKGSHTADLRRHWGLNKVLRELNDSPAWAAQNDLRDGEKDRSDHRHHAIDAIVVALTDQSRLQQLARIQREGGTETTGEIMPEPWASFRQSVVDTVGKINVSHRVQRRVAGALHEDTHYGVVREKTIKGDLVVRQGEFVVRKPIESLTQSMIEDIRDPTIRQIVIDRLKQRGVEFGRGVKGGIGKEVWQPQLQMPSGIPIRKVRVIKRDKTIQPIRNGAAYVKPGSTHHLCIFEWTERGKKKRDAIFVTMLEAAQRVRDGKPIVQRTHPKWPEAKFIMSLSRGESVLGPKSHGQLTVFNSAASTQGQVYFHLHSDARQSNGKRKFVVTANSMRRDARKVVVDSLGRIRWAND